MHIVTRTANYGNASSSSRTKIVKSYKRKVNLPCQSLVIDLWAFLEGGGRNGLEDFINILSNKMFELPVFCSMITNIDDCENTMKEVLQSRIPFFSNVASHVFDGQAEDPAMISVLIRKMDKSLYASYTTAHGYQ